MSIREEKKEVKHGAIIAAAEALFRARRYDEVTLDQIAAKARVGKGTIYLYFKGKEDLFFHMATDGFADMLKRLRATAESDRSLRDKLVEICSVVSAFFSERHLFLQVMHHEAQFLRNPAMQKKLRDNRCCMRDILMGVFRAGVRRGTLRRDCRPDVMECLLAGAMRFRNIAASVDGRAIRMEDVVDLFLAGAANSGNNQSRQTVL